MNNSVLGKTKEKCYKSVKKTKEKVQRHGTLNLKQQKKKERFGITTKLSYYKDFHRKLIDYRNKKNFRISLFI